MIALHFENLRLFIPQYVAATLIAIFIYYYLGRKYPGWQNTVPFIIKTRALGNSPESTPAGYKSGLISSYIPYRISLWEKDAVSLRLLQEPFFDLLYYFKLNGFPENVYSGRVKRFEKPSVYESAIVYQIYKIMISVSSWAGLMLVITPFSYIYVFIPHFSDPYNIIVAIVLSIAIFEGILSAIFFRIGVSLGKVVAVEGLIMAVFTLSILSPSMSWLSLFTFNGRLIIYLILLALFTIIAALISQLRTNRNLFLSSMIFSTISYFSFVGIVLYNVIQILAL